MGDGRFDGLVDATSDGSRVGARRDVAQALAEDRPGEHGRGGRSIAGDVRGLRGDLVHELGAHVFEPVFQLDFLAHPTRRPGDGRAAERFVENDVAAGRSHGHGDRVGQFLHAAEHPLSRLVVKE